MGLFQVSYGYESNLSPVQLEDRIKQRVIAAACNQGYTPNGEPTFVWKTSRRIVDVTLPVVERTP